jgi:hypothetical protein
MTFRLSQKLGTKIKAGSLAGAPLDANLLADWSCHLFTADRTQFIILCNTPSLYSCVLLGKGITDSTKFVERALICIREQAGFRRWVEPASAAASFAKALNRSVTGSMNDLVFGAKLFLTDGLSPHEIGFRLNETPLSALRYSNPREVFKSLVKQGEQE